MKCRRSSRGWFWFWLLAAFFLALGTSWADGTVTPRELLSSQSSGSVSENSPSSSSTVESPPTAQPRNIVDLWMQFRAEYPSFQLSLEAFLDQVEAFGISLEDLPAFLNYSIKSFEDSEKARMIERAEAEAKIVEAIMRGVEAEKARDRWRLATILVGIVAVLALIF